MFFSSIPCHSLPFNNSYLVNRYPHNLYFSHVPTHIFITLITQHSDIHPSNHLFLRVCSPVDTSSSVTSKPLLMNRSEWSHELACNECSEQIVGCFECLYRYTTILNVLIRVLEILHDR
jgi:hypothetical protein